MSYPSPYRIPWITYLLLGSTVLVFIWQLIVNHQVGEDRVGEMLAFSPQAWAQGHYWTLLTYGWVHSLSLFGQSDLFWLHIFANMIMLYNLGPSLEKVLGPLRFLGLYLGGTIAAALFWYGTNTQSEGAIIGASGAIFALIAAAGTVAPRVKVVIYFFFLVPIPMTLSIFAGIICGLELLQWIFGWWTDIAHTAHLGGALFGLFYVLILKGLRFRDQGSSSQTGELQ